MTKKEHALKRQDTPAPSNSADTLKSMADAAKADVEKIEEDPEDGEQEETKAEEKTPVAAEPEQEADAET